MPPHKPKPQRPTDHDGPLQVIALGLPRCATSTLKVIFEEVLDVGPCMHMSRCLPAPKKMKLVEEALREPDRQTRHGILFNLFEGCAATADFPGHLFVEDLVGMYPQAKFILNVRKDGATGWSGSMAEAIRPFYSFRYRLACWWSAADWQHYRTEVAWEEFVQRKLDVQNFWCPEVYGKHNAWVRDVAARAEVDLLEWEPSMGYGPMCELLQRPVPDVEVPRTNERDQMKKVLAWRISLGLRLWAKNVLLPCAIFGGAIAYSKSHHFFPAFYSVTGQST